MEFGKEQKKVAIKKCLMKSMKVPKELTVEVVFSQVSPWTIPSGIY